MPKLPKKTSVEDSMAETFFRLKTYLLGYGKIDFEGIFGVQWNLDLVTIYLVTTHDLVTLFGMTSFLLSKIHRFSDILLIC